MSNNTPNNISNSNASSKNIKFEDQLNLLLKIKPKDTNVGGSHVQCGDVKNEGDNKGILEASLAQDNGLGNGAIIGGTTWNKGINTHYMKSGDVINTGDNQGQITGGDTINEHTSTYTMKSGDVKNDGVNEGVMVGGNSHNKGLNHNQLIGSNIHNSKNGYNHNKAFMQGKDAVRNLQTGVDPYTRSQQDLIQQELKQIEIRLDVANEQVEILESGAQIRQDKLIKNKHNLNMNTQELDTVKHNYNEVSQKLADAGIRLKEKDKKIIKLNKTVDEQNKEITKLNQNVDEQKKQIDSLTAKSENEKIKIADLMDKWKKSQGEAKNKQQELDKLKTRIDELESDDTLALLQLNNSSAITELRAREEEVSDLSLEKSALQKEYNNLKKEQDNLIAEHEKAKEERNTCKKNLKKEKGDHEVTQKLLDEKQQKYQQTLDDLNNALESLEDIRNSANDVEEVIIGITRTTINLPEASNLISNPKIMNDRIEKLSPTEVIMGGGLSNSGINTGTVKGGDTFHIKTEKSVTNNNVATLPPISGETIEQLSSNVSVLKVAKDYVVENGTKIINGLSGQTSTLLSVIHDRVL